MRFFGDPVRKRNATIAKEVRQLAKEGRYDEALKVGIRYLHDVPDNQDVLFVVGGILYVKRRYTSALQYLERALEIGRYDPEALAVKAECHFKLEQMSRARQCWRDLLEVDPDNIRAREMLDLD